MRRKKKKQIVYSLFNLHRPLLSTTLGSFWIPSLDRRSSLTSYKIKVIYQITFRCKTINGTVKKQVEHLSIKINFILRKNENDWKYFFYKYHSYMYLLNTELQVLFVWCLCIYVYVICQILIFLSLSSISLSLSLVMFWHFFLTCNKHKRLNDPDKNCTPSNISSIPLTEVYILSS